MSHYVNNEGVLVLVITCPHCSTLEKWYHGHGWEEAGVTIPTAHKEIIDTQRCGQCHKMYRDKEE